MTTDDTVHGFGFYSSMTTENVTVHNNSTSFMALIMLKIHVLVHNATEQGEFIW